MTHFITRIQLHSANESDYDILHTEMKKESFTITGDFHLTRNAEEYKRKGQTLKDVSDAVLRAVRKTGNKDYSFTIMREHRH